jgi:uncharacterized protein (TIGR03067 family)
MPRLLSLALLAATITPLGAEDANLAKKDVDAVQGVWTVDTIEYNGKSYGAKLKLEFDFKDNVATVAGNGKVRQEYAKLAFKFDPTTMPKVVDMTVAEGIQKDASMEGIYELKGGTLKLCVRVFGKDRPADFSAPDGSSIALLTLTKK